MNRHSANSARISAATLSWLFFAMTMLIPSDADATSTFYGYQQRDMWCLQDAAEQFRDRHGRYPLTDEHSTWFEKLIAEEGYFVLVSDLHYGTTANGTLPADMHGNSLVYQPPRDARAGRVLIRSVGENGRDDGGLLDDLDVGQEPNLGYWYKRDWPALGVRAVVCGTLFLLGAAFACVLLKRPAVVLGVVVLWAGILGFVVVPYNAPRRLRPPWLDPIEAIGGFALVCSLIVLTGCGIVAVLNRRERSRTAGLCPRCHYDLRGSRAAHSASCPECGEPIAPSRHYVLRDLSH